MTPLDAHDPVQQALRRHAIRPQDAPSEGCLDDHAVAALVDGSMAGDARPEALAHLAGCPRCRLAVASVARALADPAVAREAREGKGRRWVWPVGLPVAAAAAVAILLVARPPATEPPVVTHRAPTITTQPAPAPAWPVGAVARVRELRWNAVDGADRYRVTLFAADGTVIYETQLTETAAPLPDSVQLIAGSEYRWKVEARTDWDRWVSSELIAFSIAGAPAREGPRQ